MNVSVSPAENAAPASSDPTRILIVDDMESSRAITALLLRENGFTCLEMAENGADALAKAETFAPDMVILDLEMPIMDGFTCCRALRERDGDACTIPILIQTGSEDDRERLRALELGANDILRKPVREEDLLRKVRLYLERQRTLRELTRQQDETLEARDDVLALRVQNYLLPTREALDALDRDLGVHVDRILHPSQTIGGDYWGVRQLEDGRLALYMFDFSGHGLGAAIHAYSIHNFMPEIFVYHRDPAAMLGTLNRHMCSILPYGQYAVAFLGLLDLATNQVVYAAAGTYPVMVSGPQSVTALDCAGEPLGLFRDARYENRQTTIPERGSLMLYSDALVEPGQDGTMPFTTESLAAHLRQEAPHGPAAVFQTIARRITACALTLEDDLTFILVSRRAA